MFIAIAAVAAVAALAAVYLSVANKDRAAKQKLIATPWADIGHAPEGVDIRLSGRMAHFGSLSVAAPMSGRRCAAWRILIEEEYRDGLSPTDVSQWRTVVDESESVDFLIIDDTGRARVDGTRITLVADYDAEGGAELFREVPEELSALLEKRGVQTQSWWSSQRNFRYRESALEAEELVTVAGSGRWETDKEQNAGYRGSTKVFRLGPLANGELIVGDDPALAPALKRSGVVQL